MKSAEILKMCEVQIKFETQTTFWKISVNENKLVKKQTRQ
jgi:hypothetical protein